MYHDDAVQDSFNTLVIFYVIALQYPYINDLNEKLCVRSKYKCRYFSRNLKCHLHIIFSIFHLRNKGGCEINM